MIHESWISNSSWTNEGVLPRCVQGELRRDRIGVGRVTCVHQQANRDSREGTCVTLFHRAARRVAVTDDGERVFASAQQIFQGIDDLGETVAGGRLDPRGSLRVTTSFRLGSKHIAPA